MDGRDETGGPSLSGLFDTDVKGMAKVVVNQTWADGFPIHSHLENVYANELAAAAGVIRPETPQRRRK